MFRNPNRFQYVPQPVAESMNVSYEFWKEKLMKDASKMSFSDLQNLRMYMHEGQSYLGISKRVNQHMRRNSDLGMYLQ